MLIFLIKISFEIFAKSVNHKQLKLMSSLCCDTTLRDYMKLSFNLRAYRLFFLVVKWHTFE